MSHTSDDFYSLAALKDRGWTESGVRRFLGEPDGRKPNPRYRSAAPMRLYAKTRVYEIETGEDWATWKRKRDERGAVRQAVADLKRGEIMKWVESLPITVRQTDNLTANACHSYNANKARLRDFDSVPATENSEAQFLARIKVNYLRHEQTKYDRLLWQTFGKVGTEQAKVAIRNRVLNAIASAYPDLADECARQRGD